ncbi:Glycosyl transferase 4-like domain protein [compost metagenome]|jgi:glycosyltransferase involved in cell wall biosynthesis
MDGRPLDIWIVNPYGTLPSEGWREYRSSMLARALAARGHRPTWFLSNFEHRSKSFRQQVHADPALPGVAIHCLPAQPYVRNISFGRIRYEQSFGRAFATASRTLSKPDVIVLAEPSLFFSGPVRRYARKNGIPLIVDILDLWPEMFAVAAPKLLRPLVPPLLAPLYARRRKLLRKATGVVGCTAGYADVARAVTSCPVDTFYLGVDVADVRRTMREIPDARRLPPFDGLTCVYAGTLGDAYDIPSLAASVEALAPLGRVRIVVAGDGPERPRIEQLARAYPETLVFLGKVAPHELGPIYAQAQIGLCSYALGSMVEMPVKLFDYLAAGLGFVTSLDGEIDMLIAEGAGIYCQAGHPDILAKQLTELANDPGRVKQMQHVSRLLGERFDNRQQHDNYSKFIERLVS